MSSDPADHITDLRLQLWRTGYSPLPLTGKRPLINGWQTKTEVTEHEITNWRVTHPACTNTGALTRRMPTLDIDISVEPAAEALEALAREYFEEHGFFLVRIGQPPKRAVILRTDKPFPKIVRNITAPNGTKDKIEILAEGQQVVVAGIHPDTKREYTWHGGTPWTIPWGDLPYVDEATAVAFADAAIALLVKEHGYTVQTKGNGADGAGQEDHASWHELIGNITRGEALHDSITALAAKLMTSGMSNGSAVMTLRGLMDSYTGPHDERWQSRRDEIPRAVRSAEAKPAPTENLQAQLIQTSAEFVTNFVPPDYLIDGLIQRRYLYSMTGPTGEGKTSVMLVFALHVERGWKLAGREIDKGKVLYLAGENPDDVRMRWIKLLADRNLDERDVDVFFIPGSLALSTKALRKKIEDESKANGPFALIIVDTSAAFFEGDDDNSRVQMLKHAKMLRGLIDLIDGRPTVIVTIHPVKNFSRENMVPSGGGAFLNEVDGNLTCMKVDGTMVAEVHWCGKFRGIDFGAIPFRLEVGKTDKLKDSKGRLIWTVVAKEITFSERDAAEDKGQKDKNKLLAMMAKMPGASIAVLAEKLEWFTKDGKPYKSLVQRLLDALKKDKLVKKQAGRWVLTTAGEKEVRLVGEEEDEGPKSFEMPF